MTKWIRRQDQAVARAAAIAVVVYGFFAVTQPGFATLDNTYSLMQGFMFLGLAAVAFGTTMIAGELDLAVPATATLAGVLALQHTDSIAGGILVGMLVGGAVGVGQGFLVRVVGLHSVVLTLGTSTALIGLSMQLTDNTTIVSKNLDTADRVQERFLIFSMGSLIAVVLVTLVGIVLTRSNLGTEVRAIGGARTEAIAAGVPLSRPLIGAFAISGLLSGVLGVLVSLGVGSVSASSFDTLLLPAVTAALVGGVALQGGRGSVIGISLGALTLRFVNSGMSLAGRPFYEISLAIAVLLLLVVVADLGANGLVSVVRRRAAAGRGGQTAEQPS